MGVKPTGEVGDDGNVGGRKRLRFQWVVTALYIVFKDGTYLGINERRNK